MSESDKDIHTMPSNETHECSEKCWCEPELIGDYTDQGGVRHWLHKEKQ